MPRIRTIKPEFFGSPSHRYADPWVRLFYVSMWNWADDTGRGTANPRELAAFAFPDDEDPTVPTVDDIPRLLVEVHKRYDVVFYKVDGRRYFEIPPEKWNKHQRNERKAASRYPAPAAGSPYDPGPGDGGSFTESRCFRDRDTEAPSESDGRGSAGPAGGGETPQPSGRPGATPKDQTKARDTPPDQGIDRLPSGSHGNTVTLDGSSGSGTGEPGTGEPGTGDCAASAELALVDRDECAPSEPPKRTPNQRAKTLADAYCALVPLTDFMGVRAVVRKAIEAGYRDEQIEAGLRKVAADGWPLKANTLRIAIEGLGRSRASTSDVIARGADLVAQLEAEEAEAERLASVHQITRGA